MCPTSPFCHRIPASSTRVVVRPPVTISITYVDIVDIIDISRARPLITLSILLVCGDLEAHLHTPAADACYANESPELRSLSTTLSTDIIVWLLAIQRIFYVK